MRTVIIGVIFAALWASASTAGKFGLRSAEPLYLFTFRFLVAGTIMLTFSRLISRDRWPERKEWKPLLVFGLFNTTLYLGIFISALDFLTAGITSLAIALNPLIMSIFSSLILRRRVQPSEWLAITIGVSGVALATWPLVEAEHASPAGIALIFVCMLTYSYGSIYYSSVEWKLSRLAINGWQVLFGGLMLLPLAWLQYDTAATFDRNFWLAELWLIFPVSIVSVQLWLYLLREDPVRASMWLFLCPIFGLSVSTVMLDEPFSWHTVAGTVLVLAALYLGQRMAKK